MASYAKNMVMGPILAPMTDKTKGSFGNKSDCAVANIKNNATAYLKAAGVTGVVVAGAAAVAKTPLKTKIAQKFASQTSALLGKIANSKLGTCAKVLKKGTKKLVSNTDSTIRPKLSSMLKPKYNKFGKFINRAASAVSKHPIAALAIAGATVATTALNFIRRKHAYKAGQIDQKYTDLAAAQKTLNT